MSLLHGAAAAPMGMLIGGEWLLRPPLIEIRNGFDNRVAGVVSVGMHADVDRALARGVEAAAADFPPSARSEVLVRAAARLEERAEEYAGLIAAEGVKTLREARRDPPRAARIFRLAAVEAKEISGGGLLVDVQSGLENRAAYSIRAPLGVVAAMPSWQDPLVDAARYAGAAIASGNALVLAPSPDTPLSALRLARDLLQSGLPPGRLSVLAIDGQDIREALAADSRVAKLHFAGARAEGDRLARAAGAGKVAVEASTNAASIVLADADLDGAARALCVRVFSWRGRNGFGLQRVLVHRDVFASFATALIENVAELRTGSPYEEETDVGPMLRERQAVHATGWIAETAARGARVVAGARRNGALLDPTVLVHVAPDLDGRPEEVWGPVVALDPFDTVEDAVRLSNRVPLAGTSAVFTTSLPDALTLVRRLESAAVVVNECCEGAGEPLVWGALSARESVRRTIREMTVLRTACFWSSLIS